MRLPPPPADLGLVLGWAVAEATVWPIMPDAALLPLAYRSPRRWLALAGCAAVGTLLGGALAYGHTRAHPAQTDGLLARLPLVRPLMVAAVQEWLASLGPRAVQHQPLSGVPYKVFAYEAGRRRTPLLPFLSWTLAARGSRFLAVALAGAGLGRLLGGRLERARPWLLAAFAASFGLGLARTVQRWESPAREPPRG